VQVGAIDPRTLEIVPMLAGLLECGGSDLCVKVGSPPLVRVDGELRALDAEHPTLRAADTMAILHAVLPEARLKAFETEHEIDFAYGVSGVGRFRANAYLQRGSVSLVFRTVPYMIRSLEDLGLPAVVAKLAGEERGLILVIGTTGSGKSTTLAAMVEHINDTCHKHIVTIEDPIEYLHRDRKSAIDQREVGSDTASFATALRRVMRQDPDVILIGEMRDEPTVRSALAAAETGHLVLSTVHASDATETINRILDFFPPAQLHQARAMLAGTLKGIISQRLVPRAGGDGRIAITETLVMTGRVHDLILDPKRTGDLDEVIETGAFYGMQTFDQSLYKAVQAGEVSLEEAMRYATRPHDLKLLIEAKGHLRTTMQDVIAPPEESVAGAEPGSKTGSPTDSRWSALTR